MYQPKRVCMLLCLYDFLEGRTANCAALKWVASPL